MQTNSDTWLNEPNTKTKVHVKALLTRVEAFCSKRSWSEGYFSKLAAGDVNVVKRMRAAGTVTAAKMSEIEQFMRERDAEDRAKEKASSSH